MEDFSSNTYTIRRLLKNEIEEKDRGKNYFIPPYQRPYDWKEEEVEKLIQDIRDQVDEKTDNGYVPYFIGGIVLSKESILGEKRSRKSLEVIDGQQRLTTIVLILSSVVQLLKFQDREYIDIKEVVEHLINDISKLIKIEALNFNTMVVEEKYILERSDNLKDDYPEALKILLTEKIERVDDLTERLHNTDEAKKLIKLIMVILHKIEQFDDMALIDFTLQLLNNTWLVVTKTVSIDTGIFIFEKLNDSGKLLEPQDLLKNYLFRTSTEEQYSELTEKWNIFLDNVKKINKGKSKILPKDFLDNYLSIIGKNINKSDGKKEKLFEKYKQLHHSDFSQSMGILDDLIVIASEYKNIKNDEQLAPYLNTINFKLGYLVILSFYKKYPNEYKEHKDEILSMVVRLGITYLIIGQSKTLSSIIPLICQEVIIKGDNIIDTISIVNNYINTFLNTQKSIFDDIVSSTNTFRKKPLTRLILRIIEFHLTSRQIDNPNLILLMPKLYHPECSYIDINEDNVAKYANYIGNILLDLDIYNTKDATCFQDRYLEYKNIDDLAINNVFSEIIIKNDQVISRESNIGDIGWGKEQIIERSQMIAEVAKFLIIEDNLDKNFFQ